MKNKKLEMLLAEKEPIWNGLVQDGYICYSVKELAYKVASEITNEDSDYYIGYKFYNDKHKIVFRIGNIENKPVYFGCDIYWQTGLFGDSVLLLGNGRIITSEPKGYEDIEDCLYDVEEIEDY